MQKREIDQRRRDLVNASFFPVSCIIRKNLAHFFRADFAVCGQDLQRVRIGFGRDVLGNFEVRREKLDGRRFVTPKIVERLETGAHDVPYLVGFGFDLLSR